MARRIKEKEAQNNQGRKIRFKIVENNWNNFRTEVKKIKSMVRREMQPPRLLPMQN